MRGATTRSLATVGAAFLAAASPGQESCWDNDVVPNGFNGRATSPPAFPDIRVAADFLVPEEGLEIRTLRQAHVEDGDWVPVPPVEVYVYRAEGSCPDGLVASLETSDVERIALGYQLFDREAFEYWISFDLALGAGRYAIGSRWPDAEGAGTTYWLTSDGGDGAKRVDCLSFDAGRTWQSQGADWHQAFELLCSGAPPSRGACCVPDERICVDLPEQVCEALDGTFRGDGVACADADCPIGACCFPDGSCEVLPEPACIGAGGDYRGDDVACEEADCPQPPTGACCFPSGACLRLTEDDCAGAGGLYRGDDVPCVGADCPQPVIGACCFDDGTCQRLEDEDCVAAGGLFRGDRTRCEDVECPPPTAGACCFLDEDGEHCEPLTEVECGQVFGDFRGVGVTCDEVDCLDSLCWDNGIVPDGSNWARAISPPVFPDIRVADDFTVPEGETWTMMDLRFHVLEDAGWKSGDVLQVLVYEDGAGCPGEIIVDHLVGYDQTFMGVFFDRATYTYFVDPVEFVMEPGHYWIGIRNPFGHGSGTNYWGSGDGAGRDGPGSSFGCFSLDAGETWLSEGANWQHAFQVRGVCGCPKCDADFDGDCVVTFRDLLVLLSVWGPCSPNNDCFDQDLDGDGAVTFDDLLLLLAAWGPCPA